MLWLIRAFLQYQGISKTEIMSLDFSISENEGTVECYENTFMEMKNLKILLNRNVKFLDSHL